MLHTLCNHQNDSSMFGPHRDVTVSAGVVQVGKVHAQPSTLNSLQTTCASSDPGALHHDGPRHHIIHSPIVLEEQKCDEGREKEGDGKVLVQGSDR